VEDSAGATRNAPIFFASPGQVNFLMPEGTASGPATIRVLGGSTPFQTQVLVKPTAPGLFGAGGLAAANVVTFRDGAQITTNTLRVNATGAIEPAPIDLGPDDQQVFLILYGTGIRHNAGPVTARVGSETIIAAFAGAQGTFAGQDQINIELPKTLRGVGVVDVALTVDGQATNAVKIHIQ
jgi:uncharacterized protein (TIGR03437 family)